MKISVNTLASGALRSAGGGGEPPAETVAAGAAARLRALLYVATLAVYGAVVVRAELMDYDRHRHEKISQFGRYKYRFLTTWNFIVLSIHAALALGCEFLILKNATTKVSNLKTILKLRDALFTSVVLPMSLLVMTVFWGLYAIDRELIFPRFLEPVLPPFDNHAVHTAIGPAVLLETVLRPRRAPESHFWNCIYLTAFFVCYGVPFFGTYFYHGEYLYPVVEAMSTPVFILFCGSLWAYTALLYALQWPLVSWLRGAARARHARKIQ